MAQWTLNQSDPFSTWVFPFYGTLYLYFACIYHLCFSYSSDYNVSYHPCPVKIRSHSKCGDFQRECVLKCLFIGWDNSPKISRTQKCAHDINQNTQTSHIRVKHWQWQLSEQQQLFFSLLFELNVDIKGGCVELLCWKCVTLQSAHIRPVRRWLI